MKKGRIREKERIFYFLTNIVHFVLEKILGKVVGIAANKWKQLPSVMVSQRRDTLAMHSPRTHDIKWFQPNQLMF